MFWKLPPKPKVYEALGCISDKRIEFNDNEAKVFSSSRGKFYTISFDPNKKAIMSNDNSSYWVGYLGYPSIAFLMLKGVFPFEQKYAEMLKGFAWKDINQKFKNNFDKALEYILGLVEQKGFSKEELIKEVDRIYEVIKQTPIEKLGKQTKPPEGY